MGWPIVAWSREQGRGRIASDAGALDFDASVALVDDFAIGEAVEISLVAGQVRRIAPLAARSGVAAVPAELEPTWGAAIATLTRKLAPLSVDVVVTQHAGGVLQLELHDHDWPPPARSALVTATLFGTFYVQLPTRCDRYARVVARRWSDVIAAPPRWLDRLSIDPDDVDPDAVLVCFEPSEFGERPGYVIAHRIELS